VNEEEVHVVELQTLQRVFDRPDDILVAMQVVPDLGAHEDVLTLDRRVLLEEFADGITDLLLVLVEPGTVEVPVTSAKGVESGIVGLALGTLAGEGAETDTGDSDAVVELEGLSGRHDDTSWAEDMKMDEDGMEGKKKRRGKEKEV